MDHTAKELTVPVFIWSAESEITTKSDTDRQGMCASASKGCHGTTERELT